MRVAIILAAGASSRFAGGNKLLASLGGQPLVQRAVAAAIAAPVGRIIVVLGHDRARMSRAVRHPRVTTVFARDHRRGASASLKAAMRALWPGERQLFVFLGDMPAVPHGVPARLSRALRQDDLAVRPRGIHGPGHPVLLRRPDRAMVAALAGDRGLGALLAGGTRWIESGRRQSADVDTRRDLARAIRGRHSSPVSPAKRRQAP